MRWNELVGRVRFRKIKVLYTRNPLQNVFKVQSNKVTFFKVPVSQILEKLNFHLRYFELPFFLRSERHGPTSFLVSNRTRRVLKLDMTVCKN